MYDKVKLLEAIENIRKFRIDDKDIVIIAPKNFMNGIVYKELWENNWSGMLVYDIPGRQSHINGILVVEDELVNKVVVRSLITDHRVEL